MHAFCCPLSNLSSPTPSPAQLSPAWVSIRGSWQPSKLVHTLLSRPVDFAIYLLTLCPANSQRWKFSCVKSINHVRAAVPWAVLCPSTHVCLKQLPLSLDNTPPVKRGATRALLFRWPPFSPSWAAAPILRYHRNLSATASSYLSTAVQRDIPSLDIWPSCLSVVFWMTDSIQIFGADSEDPATFGNEQYVKGVLHIFHNAVSDIWVYDHELGAVSCLFFALISTILIVIVDIFRALTKHHPQDTAIFSNGCLIWILGKTDVTWFENMDTAWVAILFCMLSRKKQAHLCMEELSQKESWLNTFIWICSFWKPE